jgi:hypothetical protein
MPERQCGRRQDVGRGSGLALPSQDVEHDIGGMNAVTERFSTGGFPQPGVRGQHCAEDIDHLSIAVIGAGKLAPHTLHRGRQNSVLERSAVAQRAGLTGQHRHIMPGVVDRLAVAE